MDRLSAMNWKKIALHTLSSPRLNKGEVVAAYKAEYDAKPGTVPRQCEEPIRLFFRGHGKSRTGGLIRQNLETAGEARKSTYGDVPLTNMFAGGCSGSNSSNEYCARTIR